MSRCLEPCLRRHDTRASCQSRSAICQLEKQHRPRTSDLLVSGFLRQQSTNGSEQLEPTWQERERKKERKPERTNEGRGRGRGSASLATMRPPPLVGCSELQTATTRSKVESTAGLGSTLHMRRHLVDEQSFHGVLGLRMNSLAHWLPGENQALDMRHASDAGLVSCSGSRKTVCNADARVEGSVDPT